MALRRDDVVDTDVEVEERHDAGQVLRRYRVHRGGHSSQHVGRSEVPIGAVRSRTVSPSMATTGGDVGGTGVTGLAWFLAALIAFVLAAAAALGIAPWAGVAVVAVLFSGWYVVATVVKRDIGALGGDGDHAAATVIFFGWLGLAFWLRMRRDLLDEKAPPGRP